MSEPTWTHWLCTLHGVSGRTNDNSLTEHQDSSHDGAQIAVLWYAEPHQEEP